MTRWLRFRWALDRAIALPLALVCAPVIGLLTVVIRRHDGGPAIVRLTRVGQHGREFQILKLRTMRATEAGGLAGGPPITYADDERVTPTGRWLRRFRLDELPQLLNVIRGEMALIGPRPETPEYVDPTEPRWRAVLEARPGIAGPTQLVVHAWESEHLSAGRGIDIYGDSALPLKLSVDQWYVLRASPLLDVLVVIALAEQFALGRSRTALSRRLERDSGLSALLSNTLAELGHNRGDAVGGNGVGRAPRLGA